MSHANRQLYFSIQHDQAAKYSHGEVVIETDFTD